MNNYYNHKYIEKSSYELHTNIFRSLEIEQYLRKTLKNYKFNLQKHKLNFSNSTLNIFLSIYEIKPNQYIISENKTSNNKEKLTRINKKIGNYCKKKPIKKIEYMRILKLYKSYILKSKKNDIKKTIRLNSLSKKITENLKLFTNNRYNVILTLQEINVVNSSKNAKNTLINFSRFEKTPFFLEGVSLLLPIITQKNPARLLSEFIASQLRTKRHNFFLNFLKESLTFITNLKFSKIQGIKIIVKGRLNNATRSRHHLITIGKIPLITIKSKIDYFESTAFTSNGTLGIKTWVCEK
jgi:ribosomal protein S3